MVETEPRIRIYPEAVLRKKACPVTRITEEVFRFAEALAETMVKRDGVGLAANQLGRPIRIFALNTTPYDDRATTLVVVNPEIISAEEPIRGEEGCLSFPGLYLDIVRPRRATIKMATLYNEPVIMEFEGLLARAVQHEIDHLDGIVFIDRAAPADADTIARYLESLKASTAC